MKRLLKWIAIPFIRRTRFVAGDCLVCGNDARFNGHTMRPYRYCSLECASYDGALIDPKKSWVLFGAVMEPKRHYEADMNGDE